LLNQLAANELRALHDYFKSNIEALKQPVGNLDQLAEAVSLHKRLLEDKPKTAARFEPLRLEQVQSRDTGQAGMA
jgi:dynein heavy chain